LREALGPDDLLPHERHEMTVLARIYVYNPIDAGARAQPQQI
jgi:hypothetical protein